MDWTVVRYIRVVNEIIIVVWRDDHVMSLTLSPKIHPTRV
jgi:hypothetical protein